MALLHIELEVLTQPLGVGVVLGPTGAAGYPWYPVPQIRQRIGVPCIGTLRDPLFGVETDDLLLARDVVGVNASRTAL